MFPSTGRVIFASASGRAPWAGMYAQGEAVVADAIAPLQTLAELEQRTQNARYAGYFSYDLGRCFEALPYTATDDLNLPAFAFFPVVERPRSLSWIATLDGHTERAGSTFSRPEYEAAVGRCLEYISAGDVFQINLSQRLAIKTDLSPSWLFLKIQQDFPAEFGATLEFGDLGDFGLVSNSPELFLRVTKLPDGRRKIVNRPIKGTRPNAPGMADELLHSEKDQAELAMIVDLQRNDLGRICEIGSVVVTEPRTIETHPTVLHGVATVQGILRDDVTLADILRATFPCGSVAGCPKIRAMEIIEELEPVHRGAYCGAIGWIGGGEMELSVAIRTMTIQDGVAYVPVGGGIVADSVPAEEYAETLTKATAMLAALGVPPR